MWHVPIKNTGLQLLSNEFTNLQKLKKLDFGSDYISISSTSQLIRNLSSLTNLSELTYGTVNINDDIIRTFGDSFEHIGLLNKFGFSGPSQMYFEKTYSVAKNLLVSEETIQYFSKCLKKLRGLKSLYICGIDMNDNQLHNIVEIFSSLENLQTLALSCNQITDNGLEDIINHLKYLHILKEIDLSRNNISDSSTQILIDNMSKCIDLKILKISCI